MIIVVDYGMGNLGSIVNMLRKIGAPVEVSSAPDIIRKAEKLILPGVGAFDHGMKNLEHLGLVDALNDVILLRKKPILGICLGMQLFSKSSEEGTRQGLGWIDSQTVRFRFDNGMPNLKIPHMGWNTVQLRREHPIFKNADNREQRFYFVHSYHTAANTESDVLAETNHGYNFVSAIQRDNIIGVQFHPEKSHRFGINFLTNFARLTVDLN